MNAEVKQKPTMYWWWWASINDNEPCAYLSQFCECLMRLFSIWQTNLSIYLLSLSSPTGNLILYPGLARKLGWNILLNAGWSLDWRTSSWSITPSLWAPLDPYRIPSLIWKISSVSCPVEQAATQRPTYPLTSPLLLQPTHLLEA